jgi:hypothetical protein
MRYFHAFLWFGRIVGILGSWWFLFLSNEVGGGGGIFILGGIFFLF